MKDVFNEAKALSAEHKMVVEFTYLDVTVRVNSDSDVEELVAQWEVEHRRDYPASIGCDFPV